MLLMWSREKMSATNDPADFLPGNDNKEEHDRRDATRRGMDKENFDVACRVACWFVIPRSHIAFPSPPRSLSGSACLVNTEHARSDPFTAKPDGEREALRSHGLRGLSSRQCIVLAGGNQVRRSISRSCGRSQRKYLWSAPHLLL